MKDSLKNSKVFLLVKNLRVILLFSLFFFVLPSISQAQVYFDLPVQMDFYRTNSDELDFSRRGVIINPSVGIVVAGNDSSRFEAHLGLGVFFSKFNQDINISTFEFNAIGPLQTSLTGYYNFSNRIQAGLGVNFGWFFVYEKELRLNIDPEYPDRLGDGYNSINFGNSADIRYNINGVFSVGAKYTYWYLPQLEYTKIGDYGEFLDSQQDLYMTRLELSVRFFIQSRDYNRK